MIRIAFLILVCISFACVAIALTYPHDHIFRNSFGAAR